MARWGLECKIAVANELVGRVLPKVRRQNGSPGFNEKRRLSQVEECFFTRRLLYTQNLKYMEEL